MDGTTRTYDIDVIEEARNFVSDCFNSVQETTFESNESYKNHMAKSTRASLPSTTGHKHDRGIDNESAKDDG